MGDSSLRIDIGLRRWSCLSMSNTLIKKSSSLDRFLSLVDGLPLYVFGFCNIPKCKQMIP